jgi:uncharacterized FAD-dependent dehydrogenase
MEFQKVLKCMVAWGKSKVPAQRMIDFTQKRVSSDIPKTSYVPEPLQLKWERFSQILTNILREGFTEFENRCVAI